MRPERSQLRPIDAAALARLADDLFDLAGDQEVRVIEALAAVLARCLATEPGDDPCSRLRGLSETSSARPFGREMADQDASARRAICNRIARRALHRSLVDPTQGATAVHRIDESPDWSRNLLPTAMFGRFLFYCPPPPRQTRSWRDAPVLS